MSNLQEPLNSQPELPSDRTQTIEGSIRTVRDELHKRGEMALGHLVYEALDHASASISHPDHAFEAAYKLYKSKSHDEWRKEAESVLDNLRSWAKANIIKVSIMVFGLGITAVNAKAMAQYMLDVATSFCEWSKSQALFVRFWGFVALMSVRLIVSTLVPPTSPGFGIIIQAATPAEQKWTAMPCFLLASAVAGAWPYIFDRIAKLFTDGKENDDDFCFTMLAKSFADNYPLTCWTGPAMRDAFDRVYQSGGGDNAETEEQRKGGDNAETEKERLEKRLKYGKLGASFAVIVGHVVPFMGAQTTIMQRFFLPHPFDTILSQPFGMTEDLVSMAMAEAVSNPVLASSSLTLLLVSFNLARGLIFTGPHADSGASDPTESNNVRESFRHPVEVARRVSRSLSRSLTSFSHESSRFSTASMSATRSIKEEEPQEKQHDVAAIASACINILVGVVGGFVVTRSLSIRAAFLVVAFQMMVQLLVVPVVLGCILKEAAPPADSGAVADSGGNDVPTGASPGNSP